MFIEQAIEETENTISNKAKTLMVSGSHVTNPYHNNKHQFIVAYHAEIAHRNVSREEITAKQHTTLALAALFHDHDHSGGKHPDHVNITRAVDFCSGKEFAKLAASHGVDTREVIDLIKITEFNGKGFVHEPNSLMAKCLRDADLCMIFSEQGRELLLGLYEEIHGKPLKSATLTEQEAFIKGNRAFLEKAIFYTDYGRRMQDEQLERSLRKFEQLVY